ncbi:MAG: phosphodiester glycosidase family protein [Pseudomonadota bacterium]
MLSSGALAEPCESVRHRDHMFTVCTADLDVHEISLRHSDAKAELIGDFRRLTETTGAPVLFAMNAGMYHPDRAPVGLYVEDGKQVTPIVTREGPGNFAMLPNGVFCLSEDRARVVESRAFAADPPACSDATQSGPMLVIDGALHPRFLPNSTFRNIRNGVGVQADGRTVHFVISDDAVTFHELATLFRDRLNAPNALYFDGRVSRLHAPGLDRSDFGLPMGPIVAVTER